MKTQIQWYSCSKPKLPLLVFSHENITSLPKQSEIISLAGKKSSCLSYDDESQLSDLQLVQQF